MTSNARSSDVSWLISPNHSRAHEDCGTWSTAVGGRGEAGDSAQDPVVGEFIVIYVEAKAGAELLTAVVEEAQRLGGRVLIVLEDVDLWCRDRKTGGAGLSELLQAMDIQPNARILTLASTNDADAVRILAALIRGISGGQAVDTAAVVAALPERTSGSDIREVVRRAVLAGDGGTVSTATLLTEVGSGRYRAEVPGGMSL